jgi:membrane protein DedA with SNARE-associated domain/membrane-associated phospholipid phosphatase
VLERLIELVSRLGDWGYLIIFLGATLEASAFLGLIVPGESLVVVAGFLASHGVFEVGDLIFLVAAGAILGDSIGYELGRRLGRRWLIHHGHRVGLRPTHLERVDAFFERHGGKTVLLGRFIGVLRALAPFVAGSAHMRYRQFLPYNVAGGILWSISFVLLGYFAGASWRIAQRWIGHASAIVGGAVLLILALGWLWRWLASHEVEVRERWARVVGHPWVLALHRRFGPQLAFVRARLSPQAYLGLHLTAGALILIGATWIFGAIAQDVVKGAPLTVVDIRVSEWLHTHASPQVSAVMRCISYLGAPPVASLIALCVGVVLLWQRYRYWLLALVVTVPGGMLLNVLLKTAFRRQGPRFEDSVLALTKYSFPSTHAMAATVLYGVLAAFAVWTIQAWRWRVLAVLVAGLLILLVGFSRVYLGAHYPSDVLAAAAEGLAWLALCLTAVDTLRRRRRGLQLAAKRAEARR